MRAGAFAPRPASPQTLESSARLAEMWPSTAPRLLRVLRLRGVDSQRAEDLVQEAGTRALELGMPFASAQDLYRWSACVVRNLHIDLTRDAARLTSDYMLASVPSGEDVEHVADRRRALAAVISAMASLSAEERRAVLTGVITDLEADDVPAGTIAVRRFRARRKLRAITSGILAWLGVTYARSTRWVRAASDGPALVPVAVAVSIAAGVLGPHVGPEARGTAQNPVLAPTVERPYRTSENQSAVRSAPTVPTVEKIATRSAETRERVPASPARAEVKGPAGTGASYEKRAADPDEPILCVSGLPGLPAVCSPTVQSDRPQPQPR